MSGIIQGCPLSGSIFVLCVDPFLRILQRTLHTNQAFANDIATIIQSRNDTSTLKTNFDLFEDVSGLDLKIKKCSLIPLGIDPTPDWLTKTSKTI